MQNVICLLGNNPTIINSDKPCLAAMFLKKKQYSLKRKNILKKELNS